MKQKLLMLLVLLVSMTSANAQRSYTFNATALNVDGLPNSILGIEINPDGKEAAGASELCGILANSGWDIVGFSEDFNFRPGKHLLQLWRSWGQCFRFKQLNRWLGFRLC